MTPQDVVALILTIGLVLVLLSGTSWVTFITDASEVAELRKTQSPEAAQFWKDILNVILGALAGYIAGRKPNDP
jgi:uncharacterized membrane protein HdeD (DUF308 family)